MRINAETERLESENSFLVSLIRREEKLARRLERVLELAKAERSAIDTDAQRVLGTRSI